jgi:hypothetical protein
MIAATYARKCHRRARGGIAMRLGIVLLGIFFLTSCGKFYYGGKPGGDFHADSSACIADVGIPSGNKQYALVAKEPYKRCMLAKGWTREQRGETAGWFRGIEEDQQVVDLATGPKQPEPSANTGSEIFCRARHLDNRGDWRDRLPAYRECLKGR